MARNGLMIALNLGKKKRNEDPPPESYRPKSSPAQAPAEEALGGAEEAPADPQEASPEAGTATSGGEASEALVGPADVDYSANDLCESCNNMGQDGNCTKYGFPVEATGHCEAGYEPKGGGMEGLEGMEAGGMGDLGGTSPLG